MHSRAMRSTSMRTMRRELPRDTQGVTIRVVTVCDAD